MPEVKIVDLSKESLDVFSDWRIESREQKPGPPERVDGLIIGLVESNRPAPHNGEVHPDGDEALIVISGVLEVHYDSAPGEPVTVGPGEACIVPKGEWHKVNVKGTAKFVHITPGPNGDHRPLETNKLA